MQSEAPGLDCERAGQAGSRTVGDGACKGFHLLMLGRAAGSLLPDTPSFQKKPEMSNSDLAGN